MAAALLLALSPAAAGIARNSWTAVGADQFDVALLALVEIHNLYYASTHGAPVAFATLAVIQ